MLATCPPSRSVQTKLVFPVIYSASHSKAAGAPCSLAKLHAVHPFEFHEIKHPCQHYWPKDAKRDVCTLLLVRIPPIFWSFTIDCNGSRAGPILSPLKNPIVGLQALWGKGHIFAQQLYPAVLVWTQASEQHGNTNTQCI